MTYLNRPNMMRYKFNFRYKAYNNEFHDFPIVITAMDDLNAYEMALASFRDIIRHNELSLHIRFVAPENLTIIMRKELS